MPRGLTSVRRPLCIGAAGASRPLCLSPLGLMSAALGGCGKRGADFANLDITGSRDFDPRFSLADSHGTLRTIADWHGKVVVLLFGYAQCPDVCPTSLAELARAKERLGADGNRLQVVFLTVDPDRDTPAILTEYVRAFDAGFVALRPETDAAVQQLAKQFHIYVAKTPATSAAGASMSQPGAGHYGIAHTAASFVFDPEGRLRLYAKDGEGVDRWVHDARLLLAPERTGAA